MRASNRSCLPFRRAYSIAFCVSAAHIQIESPMKRRQPRSGRVTHAIRCVNTDVCCPKSERPNRKLSFTPDGLAPNAGPLCRFEERYELGDRTAVFSCSDEASEQMLLTSPAAAARCACLPDFTV